MNAQAFSFVILYILTLSDRKPLVIGLCVAVVGLFIIAAIIIALIWYVHDVCSRLLCIRGHARMILSWTTLGGCSGFMCCRHWVYWWDVILD